MNIKSVQLQTGGGKSLSVIINKGLSQRRESSQWQM